MVVVKVLARVSFALLFFIALAVVPSTAQQPVLTLVYKDIGNPPYMGKAPDNSGLYHDLISRAVQKIGFDLRIVRKPKKRTYEMLELGKADLYPSGEFRDYRSEFIFYIPNGLFRHEHFWGVTARSIPELHKISDINSYELTWVVELGSSWPLEAADHNVPHSELKEISMDKAIHLLQNDRPFFFRFTKEQVESYMKEHSITSWKSMGIRVHKFCCEHKQAPLYTNFSRNSPYYQEEVNPNYDMKKPLSVENLPYRLVPGSVPYRLQEALQEMKDSGEVEALARKYFGDKWESIVHCL